MSIKTPLYQTHANLAAQFTDFAGYTLPLHYGSSSNEHQMVRESAGMFDASHMVIVDLHGNDATAWLRQLLSNDVAKLTNGRALYTCMCRESGGVIDDLIVYRLADDRYRLILNAANREKDLAWMEAHRPPSIRTHEIQGQAVIAIQGPDAVRLTQAALAEMDRPMDVLAMNRFSAVESGDWFVARTGYTGEDGLEIVLPASQSATLWAALAAQDIGPAGLGARESLRVEAGLCLYGQELDEEHTPAESGIASTIDIEDPDRDFIGRDVLEDHKLFGGRCRQVGIVLDGRGAVSKGQAVELVGKTIGRITSSTFSPTREVSLALARVDREFKGGCDVNSGDRLIAAHIASIPFVPHGQARE